MRGRKPVPTALKRLAGNPGHRPLNDDEPTPMIEAPDCPPHLTGEAREEWNRITEQLLALGLLTELDRAALTAYCAAWGRLCDAERHLAKHGSVVKAPSGFPIQNPYLAIANKAIEQIAKIGVEFGFTPSSRSRIRGATPQDQDDDEFFFELR